MSINYKYNHDSWERKKKPYTYIQNKNKYCNYSLAPKPKTNIGPTEHRRIQTNNKRFPFPITGESKDDETNHANQTVGDSKKYESMLLFLNIKGWKGECN